MIHALEARSMFTERTRMMTLYVDRSRQQWIVRDPDGNFWVLPFVENAWEHRQPFHTTEETELEPVPGHYKHMLGLPP
jgi:hypothetical protein